MLLTMVLHHKRLSFILANFFYGHLNKLDTGSLIGSLRSDATVVSPCQIQMFNEMQPNLIGSFKCQWTVWDCLGNCHPISHTLDRTFKQLPTSKFNKKKDLAGYKIAPNTVTNVTKITVLATKTQKLVSKLATGTL